MSAGKRLSLDEPLTEHDVAERLNRAALRVVRIMADARQQGYMEPVKHSRYLTNVLSMLMAELQLWNIEPQASWTDDAGPGRKPAPGQRVRVLAPDGHPLAGHPAVILGLYGPGDMRSIRRSHDHPLAFLDGEVLLSLTQPPEGTPDRWPAPFITVTPSDIESDPDYPEAEDQA